MLKIFNIYDSICGTCQFWSNPDKALAFQNVIPYIQISRRTGTMRPEVQRIDESQQQSLL